MGYRTSRIGGSFERIDIEHAIRFQGGGLQNGKPTHTRYPGPLDIARPPR